MTAGDVFGPTFKGASGGALATAAGLPIAVIIAVALLAPLVLEPIAGVARAAGEFAHDLTAAWLQERSTLGRTGPDEAQTEVRISACLCGYRDAVAHGQLRRIDQLDGAFAQAVAETMQALSAPSRVRILGQLSAGPQSVGDLAAAVEMTPAAVSQQLRVLRHLGFVTGARDGQRIIYDLHDDHVGELLEAAIGHVEHLQLGLSRAAAVVSVARRQRAPR